MSAAGAGDAGVGLAGRALAVAAGGLQQGLHARVGVVAVHLVTCHGSRVTCRVTRSSSRRIQGDTDSSGGRPPGSGCSVLGVLVTALM